MLAGNYFDGVSTRMRSVELSLSGDDLVVTGEEVNLQIPISQVSIDERLGRAPRRLRFKDGTFCEVRDVDALERLLSLTTHRDGWVDRTQRKLKAVLASGLALVLLGAAAYVWVLPWAAARSAQRLPPIVGRTLTSSALAVLDQGFLRPTQLSEDRQQELLDSFHELRMLDDGPPDSQLLFRESPQLGANAFTLPDGTIVVLDGLVTTIGDDREILAALAHELGHAHGHHGLQQLLQTSAVAAFLALYIGDFSTLLASAPAAVIQARYSQDLERQADDFGAALLIHNGLSPKLLVDVLRKLSQSHPESSKEGYLSTHPSTDERMRHLEQLGALQAGKPQITKNHDGTIILRTVPPDGARQGGDGQGLVKPAQDVAPIR